MKNDTMNDYEYFMLGLQVANTVDIFEDRSNRQSDNSEDHNEQA